METSLPYAASEYSSKTVFDNCSMTIEYIQNKLQQMGENCNIREFVSLEEIEKSVFAAQNMVNKLKKRDIVFIGNTGIGKSFLLNLLFVMTSVDPRRYAGTEYRRARQTLHAVAKIKEDFIENISDFVEGPVLRILHLSPPNESRPKFALGLEALCDFDCKVNIILVNPLINWRKDDPELAERFEKSPSEDHEYRLKRYEEYCKTRTLIEEDQSKVFRNFLLPSFEKRFKSTTIAPVRNSFGYTFHLCLEFFSEDEVKGRAKDWINVVRISLVQRTPEICDNDNNGFLKESFEVLFPSLADRVSKAKSVDQLPNDVDIGSYLDPFAAMLIKQRFHIFAGQGRNYHQDQLFIMKTFEEELGIGTIGRSHHDLVKCYMIKKVQNYVPSSLLVSGCSITDSPGTGDDGSIQRFLLQQALSEHDVVVAVCPSSLHLNTATSDALFKNSGTFGFASRLLKDPAGKNLVIMHYYERSGEKEKALILSGELDEFHTTQVKTDDQSLEDAMKGFERVGRALSIISDREKLVGCIHAFTTFPVIYYSLILNSSFARAMDESVLKNMIQATEGHKFLILPELLGLKQWQQELEQLQRTVTERSRLIKDDKKEYQVSDPAKRNISTYMDFCTSSSSKKKSKYKESLDLIGSAPNTGAVRSWETLQIGDTLTGYYRENPEAQEQPWQVKLVRIDPERKQMDIVFLTDKGEHYFEKGLEFKHTVKFIKKSNSHKPRRKVKTVSDTTSGETTALELEMYSIDTLLAKFSTFQGKLGLINKIMDQEFDDHFSRLVDVVPLVEEELRRGFRAIRGEDVEERTAEIFSQTFQGKCPSLNIVDVLLKHIDRQLLQSFSKTTDDEFEELQGSFNFNKIIQNLKHELLKLRDFIGERIKFVIFNQLCSQEAEEKVVDQQEIGGLYQEYMEVGSKSLEDRINQVFSLGEESNTLSKHPAYDFLSKLFRSTAEKIVMEMLMQDMGETRQAKTSYLLSQVRPILESVLQIVKSELNQIYAVRVTRFKYDFVTVSGRTQFQERFVHTFIVKFTQKLHNTINRADEGHRNFIEDVAEVCSKVDEMMRSLPTEENIGVDIHQQLRFGKALRDIRSKLDEDQLKCVHLNYLKYPHSQNESAEIMCLHSGFAALAIPMPKKIDFESLPVMNERDLKISFEKIDYTVMMDEDHADLNTLWRALATQFIPFPFMKLPAIPDLQVQLSAAVADQMCLQYSAESNRSNAQIQLGFSVEDFAARISTESLDTSNVEVCLHFFAMCFCRVNKDDKGIKGINIWLPGLKYPKYQIAFRSTPDELRRQFHLELGSPPVKSDAGPCSMLIDFGKSRPSMHAINIAIWARNEDGRRLYSFAGLSYCSEAGKRKRDGISESVHTPSSSVVESSLKRHIPQQRPDIPVSCSQNPSASVEESSRGVFLPRQRLPVEHSLNQFDAVLISKMSHVCSKKPRVLLFDVEALFDVQTYLNDICSKRQVKASLIDLLKVSQAVDENKHSQRIVVVIPHVVEKQIKKWADKIKEKSMLANFDQKKKVLTCYKLRVAIIKEFLLYGENNPEENIQFILQDEDHQLKCFGDRETWNSKASVFSLAKYVHERVKDVASVDLVVSDELGAEGIYNSNIHLFRGCFQIISYAVLVKAYEKSKEETEIWDRSFGAARGKPRGGQDRRTSLKR